MAWIWAALMPHPPIIVSEIGRGLEQEARATIDGISELINRLKEMPHNGRPDVMLILSPHQPYVPGALYMNTAPVIQGGLGRFNAPEVKCSINTPQEKLAGLIQHLHEADFPIVQQPVPELGPDHGTQVPLYFMEKAFDGLPPAIIANPVGLTPEKARQLGELLAKFSDNSGNSWALLASGDLSHRLSQDSPAGYNPEGTFFDQDVIEALEAGTAAELMNNWPPSRLEQAGECGFRPILTLLNLVKNPLEVFSYEGPFGVGYCNALWRISPEN